MNRFVILSKDAMCTDYLPVYGNKMWHTPNIDEIAKQGTVFRRHYTAAPSTIMSFYSMVTEKYAHESGFDIYEKTYREYEGETIFQKIKQLGYENHIIWAQNMMPLKDYLDYFHQDVYLHPVDIFRQGVGAHYIHEGFLKRNKDKEIEAFDFLNKTCEDILTKNNDVFLWIHFPHVIKGEVCYGGDIELFDKYVGMIREYVPDDCIVITADHGNMNGHKGKLGYAFDVYEQNIRVPFITPRIDGKSEISTVTSSLDIFRIVFEKSIPQRDFVFSDSAYRAQPNRKIAIVADKYKYIYNKRTKTEELYDLLYDPQENFSLMSDYTIDKDRKIIIPSRELYYYPDWDELEKIRNTFRTIKNQIWENGSWQIRLTCFVKDLVRPLYEKIAPKKKIEQ